MRYVDTASNSNVETGTLKDAPGAGCATNIHASKLYFNAERAETDGTGSAVLRFAIGIVVRICNRSCLEGGPA